jgi:hypothetical protein
MSLFIRVVEFRGVEFEDGLFPVVLQSSELRNRDGKR